MTTIATLQATASQLDSSPYDLAAGLNERSFNDFLDAHWKLESASANSIYEGKGRLEEVAITYHYKITKPSIIDLMPLTSSRFARILSGWATTVAELASYSPQLFTDDTPPNFQVRVPGIEIRVETDTGISVTLNVAAKITGFVTAIQQPGSVRIRLVPIDARIEEQDKLVALIKSRLQQASPAAGVDDCVELYKLILYIVNVLLANRIGSFVKEFDIPLPIELFEGISITSFDLSVLEDTIFIRTTIDAQSLQLKPSEIDTLVAATRAQDVKKNAEKIATLDLHSTATLQTFTGGNIQEAEVAQLQDLSLPNKGVFLILHEHLFQLLADKYLVMDQKKTDSGSFLGINWEVGTRLRTWSPTATVVTTGLNVSAEFEGSAWIRLWIHTHCGDISHTTSATARATPRINSRFSFDLTDRESLWVSVGALFFPINWTIGGIPFPFNKLLEFILEFLTNLVVLFVALFGVRWRHKLTSIPETFPPTNIRFTPNFDRRITKIADEKALLVAAEPDFLP